LLLLRCAFVAQPFEPEAVRRRARVLLELGRPLDALAEVRRVLAINPSDPEGLEIEGLCHLRRGDHDAALAVLGRAIAEAPENAHAHYLRGFALREVGRPADAELPLTTALRLVPDEPVYLRALAELYADLKRHTEALTLARRATEVAPDRAANHVTYGFVASAAGDKQLARVEYERAVALDPADAAAWNNLGCLDLEAGRPLRARARFREALRLDPRGERAQRNLALVATARLDVRGWDDLVAALMRELVRAGAPKLLIVALAVEESEAMAALVRGGRQGALLSGAALVLALRAMGPAAIVPISVASAVAGVVWLGTRNRLPDERARVRRELATGRVELERVWQAWLSGATTRAARDEAIGLLVEKMAFALVEGWHE
jgi:Flp pilus assembly protein TadD